MTAPRRTSRKKAAFVPDADGRYRQRLEAAKQASTLQLLFKASRLLDEEGVRRVARERGAPELRRSHTALLPHIDLEGTRISDLADRLGVTKQAVSQLVDELEALGVVARHPDPGDARARRVAFTPRGRAGLLEGLATLRTLEAELAEGVGEGTMSAFKHGAHSGARLHRVTWPGRLLMPQLLRGSAAQREPPCVPRFIRRIFDRASAARFNFVVPDVIEPSPSGRAKCRGCGRVIEKATLRFGESLPNPYAEGEALFWFHLPCAAMMRPEKVLALADASVAVIPENDELRRLATFGVAHRRLPRLAGAERASSGRAHCRHCRELIPKGEFRLRLQMFEEGRMTPIGTIHASCAEPYFGTRDILERVVRLTPELTEPDTVEIARALATPPPALPPLAKTQGDAETEAVDGDEASESDGRAHG